MKRLSILTCCSVLLIFTALIAPLTAQAVATKSWTDESRQDFSSGEHDGMALHSDGALGLAPRVTLLTNDAPDAAISTLTVGPEGSIVAGTSFNGTILIRRPGDDDFHELTRLPLPLITALLHTGDAIWAAAAPGGIVAVIDPSTGDELLRYEVNDTYVWCLFPGDDGVVLGGTGPNGNLVALHDGQVRDLVSTGQRHVMDLARRSDGTFVAVTSEDGLVLDLGPTGEGPMRALFHTNQPECRAIVIDPDSDVLYVLATTPPRTRTARGATRPAAEARRTPEETKESPDDDQSNDDDDGGNGDENGTSAEASVPRSTIVPAADSDPVTESKKPDSTEEPQTPSAPTAPPREQPSTTDRAAAALQRGNLSPRDEAALRSFLARVRGATPAPRRASRVPFSDGAEHSAHAIYAIQPDGLVRTLFSSGDAVLFDMIRDTTGHLLIGSGNEGFIYRLDPSRGFAERIARLCDDQALSLTRWQDEVIIGAGNRGNLYALSATDSTTGQFTSAVKTLPHTARFGTIRWQGDDLDDVEVSVSTRSGFINEPDDTWSSWYPADSTTFPQTVRSTCPPARFFQYRIGLNSSSAATNDRQPRITAVRAHYRTLNLPPRVRSIEITAPSVETRSNRRELREAVGAQPAKPAGTLLPHMRRVAWKAEDPNDDPLLFRLHARREGEDEWLTITNRDIDATAVIWETMSIPDGWWRLRVEAHDGTANPPEDTQTASLTSSPFLIDNTPPIIRDVTISHEPDQIIVAGVAEDATSAIANVEYSLDGEHWSSLAPKDGMFDSPVEAFVGRIPLTEETQAVSLGLKAFDEFGNMTTQRLLLPRNQPD